VAALALERITEPSRFGELRDGWREVWAVSADRSPFLTWEWVTTWWQHFGARDQLELLVAKDGDRVVGIAPLLRARVGVPPISQTMLVGIGQENADYGGFLLGEHPAATGALFVGHVFDAAQGGVSVNLTRLRPEGDLLPIVQDEAARRAGKVALVEEQTTAYPYLDLSALDEPAAYLHKMDTRNDVRRRTKRLAELHELRFDYDADPTDANLGALFALSGRRWDTKDGRMAGLFAGARGRAFIADVSRKMQPTGHVRVSLLWADDLLVAARFGFECDGAYLGYKECFDPDYSKYGPGQMLTSHILHLEVEEGMREFDFLRGEGAHKAAWVNAERRVGYWTIHPGGTVGRLRRKLMWNQLRLRLRRWTD
jgi:CelD/BcsL family acetyltransferase involved in cellulose biosynthesis